MISRNKQSGCYTLPCTFPQMALQTKRFNNCFAIGNRQSRTANHLMRWTSVGIVGWFENSRPLWTARYRSDSTNFTCGTHNGNFAFISSTKQYYQGIVAVYWRFGVNNVYWRDLTYRLRQTCDILAKSLLFSSCVTRFHTSRLVYDTTEFSLAV